MRVQNIGPISITYIDPTTNSSLCFNPGDVLEVTDDIGAKLIRNHSEFDDGSGPQYVLIVPVADDTPLYRAEENQGIFSQVWGAIKQFFWS